MTRPVAPWESAPDPGKRAVRVYLSIARELRRMAYEAAAEDKPLKARVLRYQALMVERAAKSEESQP